jgi:acyl-coenzyme A synthetase/AMP-(fatty) acid ligase
VKWLKGGVEFGEMVPKRTSGKILRRLLNDQDDERKKKSKGPKL